jgi:CBS-domain-containing membrane protein
MEKCKDFVGESIPVIDENRRLLGIFSENDLFIYYSKAQEMRKTEETKA